MVTWLSADRGRAWEADCMFKLGMMTAEGGGRRGSDEGLVVRMKMGTR